VVQHRGTILVDDVTKVNGSLVTSGTRTALDITTVATVEQALVTVNGLLHAGHTSLDHLRLRYSSMEHWANTLATEVVLSLAEGRNESAGESRLDYFCYKHGLPKPESQYEIRRHGRPFAYLDKAWPALKTWAEFDGRIKYTQFLRDGEDPGDAVWREKKREDELRRITGWICVRVTWADLEDPWRLVGRFRDAFFGYPSAA
jgi:hypothetical protein